MNILILNDILDDSQWNRIRYTDDIRYVYRDFNTTINKLINELKHF